MVAGIIAVVVIVGVGVYFAVIRKSDPPAVGPVGLPTKEAPNKNS